MEKLFYIPFSIIFLPSSQLDVPPLNGAKGLHKPRLHGDLSWNPGEELPCSWNLWNARGVKNGRNTGGDDDDDDDDEDENDDYNVYDEYIYIYLNIYIFFIYINIYICIFRYI